MNSSETIKKQIIVAMKGHPGTGKSTLAKAIATALCCPLLDKDDIRDSTLSLSSTCPASLLNHLSYTALWRVSSTQLSMGLSLVIDSPLSRRGHLDSILTIAAGRKCKVVVVECKPSDQDEWRRRVERRGAECGGGTGWHKPATWQDMERLLEEYDGCTEYEVGDEVGKIVVDTTGPDGLDWALSNVLDFIQAHCSGPLGY